MQDQTTLPFPIQNTLTGSLRQWAASQSDAEYQSLWAGTAYAQVRSMSTAALLQKLNDEIDAAK
jgi:nitronate monooxygenase